MIQLHQDARPGALKCGPWERALKEGFKSRRVGCGRPAFSDLTFGSRTHADYSARTTPQCGLA